MALVHAAAYIRNEDITVAEHRRLLVGQRQRVGEVAPEIEEAPDVRSATVAAAVALSIQAVNGEGLVGLAGLLDPNGIPVAVVVSQALRSPYPLRTV